MKKLFMIISILVMTTMLVTSCGKKAPAPEAQQPAEQTQKVPEVQLPKGGNV